MKKTAKDAISKAIEVLLDSGVDLSTLFDQGGLLKQLSQRLVEKALRVLGKIVRKCTISSIISHY